MWITILAYADHKNDEIASSFGIDLLLPPAAHVFVTDILPFALSYFCAYLSIHMEGKVGILDTQNIYELYIAKRGGGKVRNLSEEEAYELNKEDPDRVFYDLDDDNEVIDDQVNFRITTNKSNKAANKMKGVII